MQLGLTIPLMRQLKMKALPSGSQPDCACWDLHSITLRGCSTLLAVNCFNCYTFTLFDMTLADWGNLSGTFLHGLSDSLFATGISEDAVARYLQGTKDIALTKTHGRREVAFLNRAWEDILTIDYTLDPQRQAQPLLDAAVNALPCRCAGHSGVETALERLKHDLILAK